MRQKRKKIKGDLWKQSSLYTPPAERLINAVDVEEKTRMCSKRMHQWHLRSYASMFYFRFKTYTSWTDTYPLFSTPCVSFLLFRFQWCIKTRKEQKQTPVEPLKSKPLKIGNYRPVRDCTSYFVVVVFHFKAPKQYCFQELEPYGKHAPIQARYTILLIGLYTYREKILAYLSRLNIWKSDSLRLLLQILVYCILSCILLMIAPLPTQYSLFLPLFVHFVCSYDSILMHDVPSLL